MVWGVDVESRCFVTWQGAAGGKRSGKYQYVKSIGNVLLMALVPADDVNCHRTHVKYGVNRIQKHFILSPVEITH